MAFLDGKAGRDWRSGFGITGYVGPNGSGKSLTAVFDTMPSLDAGRPVLSTVRLLDYDDPRPCDDPDCDSPSHPDHMAAHPCWIPLRDWSDLLHAEHCDVLLDEVTGVASSRESMQLPGPIANLLVQLRRRDVVMRWTSPSWARADRIIRETTQAAVICKGMFGKRDAGRVWPSNRLIKTRLLDARDLDELTEHRREATKAMNVSWMLLSRCAATGAYDTLDRVMSIPSIDGGRCLVCGGRRRVPACTCGDV